MSSAGTDHGKRLPSRLQGLMKVSCGWSVLVRVAKGRFNNKQGQGDHISAQRFAQLDLDSLWDSTWGEMEKIQKIRHHKATPAQDDSPRSAPTKRPFEVPLDWPADAPVPPRPKMEPDEKND